MMESISSAHSVAIFNEFLAKRDDFKILLKDRENLTLRVLELLDVIERIKQNWKDERLKSETTLNQLRTLEDRTEEILKETKLYKEHLRDARAQIAALVSDKQRLELVVSELKRKFQHVHQVIRKDSPRYNSEEQKKLTLATELKRQQEETKHRLTNDTELDFDITSDSTTPCNDINESHLRNGKIYRRSKAASSSQPKLSVVSRTRTEVIHINEAVPPNKRPRKSSDDGIVPLANNESFVTDNYHTPVSVRNRSLNRSFSESTILNQSESDEMARNFRIRLQATKSHVELRSPVTPAKTWINDGRIDTRPHTFANFTAVLLDRCDVCTKYFGIGRKCSCKCSDCGLRVHILCKAQAALPCIPRTPNSRTPCKQRLRLRDFCPATHPMIPNIIIHCVVALERDRLNDEGLYRIPGQELQVTRLLNDFKSCRTIPKLENHFTETLTGCIKKFLKELREPLIPLSSWEEFISAAERDDKLKLSSAVADLPAPNLDTLAYLCAHFQRVCNNSIRNKMTPLVLARCVAPTVIGSGPCNSKTVVQGNEESKKQTTAMLALLEIPSDYWESIYSNLSRVRATIARKRIETVTPGLCYVSTHKILTNNAPNEPSTSTKTHGHPGDSLLGPLVTPPSGTPKTIYRTPGRFENLY